MLVPDYYVAVNLSEVFIVFLAGIHLLRAYIACQYIVCVLRSLYTKPPTLLLGLCVRPINDVYLPCVCAWLLFSGVIRRNEKHESFTSKGIRGNWHLLLRDISDVANLPESCFSSSGVKQYQKQSRATLCGANANARPDKSRTWRMTEWRTKFASVENAGRNHLPCRYIGLFIIPVRYYFIKKRHNDNAKQTTRVLISVNMPKSLRLVIQWNNKKAVLSQGGPRDAAVNFSSSLRIEVYSGIGASHSFHCDSTAFELNNSINHG